MSQISIIKKSDIQEARRFDAEFFKPEYLEIEKKIKKSSYFTFDEITKLFVKGIFDINSSVYTTEGVPFARISNLKDLKIDDNDIVYITEEENTKNKKTELKYGDIILSKTAYPACSLVTLERCNASQDTIAIKLKDNDILSKFLVVFLNTKYGMSQMRRYFTGNIQMHLNLIESKQILIPRVAIIFQEKIDKLFDQSIKKQTQSKQLYKEAEEALLKEVGLLDYKPEHILSFQTTKKETDEAERFDAEYFQPKYEEIIKKIEKYKNGWDYVKNIVHHKKGVEVGSETYQQDGMSFGRVSDFSINGVEKTGKKISKGLYQELRKDYQPKRNDILFTKDGTIGLSYVVKEEFEVILSGAFLRLSLKEKYQSFEKECLSLIFNSIISKMQVEKLSGGAIIAHLKPSDFEKFKIPLIKPQIQKQIAKKIQESHKLRKESKELLEEAKRKVEEEIEK